MFKHFCNVLTFYFKLLCNNVFSGSAGKDIRVVAKVGCALAVDNIQEIIDISDGIFIDRGAIGNELQGEKLFLAQKSIIAKCNQVYSKIRHS